MQLSAVLLNAFLAFSGVANALPTETTATLTDISVIGEISKIPEEEIAPSGIKTVFEEDTSPNSGLNKRIFQWGTCLGHDGLAPGTVTKYKRDVSLVFDQIAQWDPSSSRTVQAGNKWTWIGPTSGGNRRVQITVRNQVLASVLRNCESTRSGWAYVSWEPILVAIVHDKTIAPPPAHLTCP
ncbi:hypothetical protein DER46DRAFT_624712 [Fusarium sp. MPI-SDFR-AT-0072]|nr:hypothetical protein DER46DRAFT_624712 [Fusarium sp. MPI-SDFR-AT-0072]